MLGNPDAIPVVREAAARRAVALGGAPWLAEDQAYANRLYAQLAADLGINLDLHVDESDDPSVRTLDALAAAAIDTGLAGKTFATTVAAWPRGRRPLPAGKPSFWPTPVSR